MGHLSYESAVKAVYRGLILLAVVTLVEVAISLLGAGYLDFKVPTFVRVVLMLAIGALSIYKAYFIIFEFMHLKYEVKGLAWSVLLPTLLLVWAIIAFFQEGSSYGSRRQNYGNTRGVNINAGKTPAQPKPQGMLQHATLHIR